MICGGVKKFIIAERCKGFFCAIILFMKSRNIFLGGINGTGKTTLISELGKNDKFRVLYGSDLLMEKLGISKGDYDSLRMLSRERIQKALNKMLKDLLSPPSDKQYLVFTGHYIDFHEGRLERNVGEWISQFDTLVHLVAEPKIIAKRIGTDNKDRKNLPKGLNDSEKLQYLKNCQDMSLKEMKNISEKYDISTVILKNNAEVQGMKEAFLEIIDKTGK
jgi:adenylate kinase